MINLIKLLAFVQEEIESACSEQAERDKNAPGLGAGFVGGKIDALKVVRCEIAGIIAKESE